MTLAKDLIEQFQRLYLAKFGEQISYGRAEQELKELAGLVRITSPKKGARQCPSN